jgi:glycerol-3-phosphate dehydrogenase (NAD(P)+)
MRPPTQIKSALVLGAGGWGTALANTLAMGAIRVQFWGRDSELMRRIDQHRLNDRYLPGVPLSQHLRVVEEVGQLEPSDVVLFVVPSKGIAQTAALYEQSQAYSAQSILLSCTKGIDQESLRRPSQILSDLCPGNPVAVLTGPNHAEEVGRQMPTAAVVACANEQTAQAVQNAFTPAWFRIYTSTDVVGAEWCAVLKNCYAIAAGIGIGLGLGDNAMAALVTRALAEMNRLVTALGGRVTTCQGLAGVGDLMATCYSPHSRNRALGIELGRGRSLEQILRGSHTVAEGLTNSASLHELARSRGIEAPILSEVHQILVHGKAAASALGDLLSREAKAED